MRAVTAETDRLLRNLPGIRRARLWRLYAYSGERFLDLWMDGGRAILGAKGSGIGTSLKAAIDMGLSRPMPSPWEARLRKELLRRWPAYTHVLFYRSETAALRALGERGEAELRILRPFGEYLEERNGNGEVQVSVATALLPCPSALSPGVLLFRNQEEAHDIAEELVPPLQLAGLVRALFEFDGFTKTYTEKHWRRVDRFVAGAFERKGPYLVPLYPRERHEDYFLACLAAGLLISPDYDTASMIPGDFDDGELAKLPRI